MQEQSDSWGEHISWDVPTTSDVEPAGSSLLSSDHDSVAASWEWGEAYRGVCMKIKNCGKHRCYFAKDHPGKCHRCSKVVDHAELRCECGKTVRKPPIRCGFKLKCAKLCSRDHHCDHEIRHSCHKETTCPPCEILASKQCRCGRRIMLIPCHERQSEVSCGGQCGKLLKCLNHRCQRMCHSCTEPLVDDDRCNFPCREMFSRCGHVKCEPCTTYHKTRCQQIVEVGCICNCRREEMPCWKMEEEHKKVYDTYLSEKMEELQITPDKVKSDTGRPKPRWTWEGPERKCKDKFAFKLPCTEDCSPLTQRGNYV